MSFLTKGKWNRPAMVLGFDPVALVQRAMVTGLLPKPGAPASTPALRVRQPKAGLETGAPPKKNPAQLMRELRARRKAAGLTREGKPKTKFNKVHPELRGLPRREYLTRFMRLRRGKPTSGPIRPYRKAIK